MSWVRTCFFILPQRVLQLRHQPERLLRRPLLRQGTAPQGGAPLRGKLLMDAELYLVRLVRAIVFRLARCDNPLRERPLAAFRQVKSAAVVHVNSILAHTDHFSCQTSRSNEMDGREGDGRGG